MSTIKDAKVGAPLWAPTGALRARGYVTSLFQGCAYAEDPRDHVGSLFQLQAVRTGPGDVEDLRIHRFGHLNGGAGQALGYIDTMTIKSGGHVQSAHARISAAGNPYLWLGLERYDKHHRQIGADLHRVRYAPDRVAKDGTLITTTRESANVQRVYTGGGTVMAVGCPDWTVVLRRPDTHQDVYEWHSERSLLGLQARYKGSGVENRPKPFGTVTVAKVSTDDAYQSALAQGKWTGARADMRLYRLSGANGVQLSATQNGRTIRTDLTGRVRAAIAATQFEPEGLVTIDKRLHISVQTGPVATRRLAYLPVTW